jgi:hypothetical protein
VAHLTALTQFARFAPNALETKSEDILAFVVRDVLGAPTSADEVSIIITGMLGMRCLE